MVLMSEVATLGGLKLLAIASPTGPLVAFMVLMKEVATLGGLKLLAIASPRVPVTE